VDDEPVVLQLISRILRRAGYEVVEARDGKEAAARAASSGSLAAVVIDATVPPDGALPATRALQELAPDLGVVFTSGEALRSPMRSFLEGCAGRFLAKPFSPAELVAAVEAVLRGGPPSRQP